jgi:nicotinate-nucleotide adenylyltransferase
VQKICLFGGTFNPIHSGHIELSIKVYDHFKLDKLYIIPSYISPHKEDVNLDPKHRLELIKLAFANCKRNIEVSDYEINKKDISYTYKTLKYFRKLYPEDMLFFLTGADIFATIHKWKRYKELFEYSNFIVLNRKEKPFDEMISEIPKEVTSRFVKKVTKKFGQIIYFETDEYPISSTEIRNYLKEGKTNDFLPDIVYNYIKENKLYRGENG